uniref:NADH dehydrogenase subunit 4L n=1 Tax=Taeniothrips eucharii TaxID=1818613 RepID=UPI0030DE12B5
MLSNYFLELVFFFYLSFFFCYLYNFFSFFNCLLLLESISLFIFISSLIILVELNSFKFSLFYLVFIVCESAMGLSILVKSVKYFGVNTFRSMNLNSF